MKENYTSYVTIGEDVAEERFERLEQAKGALCFGLKFLDDSLLHIFKKDLVLVAARSAGGKSELINQIAFNNAMAGKRVTLLSLESETREVSRRLLFKRLCSMYYADQFRHKDYPNYLRWYAGKQEHLFENYYDAAIAELKKITNLEIRYKGLEEFGLNEIKGVFASKKYDTDLIILDHLHFMDFADENENRAQKEILKKMRDMVLGYGIPLIVVAHIRKSDRRNPNPVPDLEDIHGSSDIFKIATKAITLAPATDASFTSTKFPTYMKVVKCRQDGSLQRYSALTHFDISKNAYTDDYCLGNHNAKGEFELLTDYPYWAKKN